LNLDVDVGVKFGPWLPTSPGVERLVAAGGPAGDRGEGREAPPFGSLFAAFLGYNPMETLLGDTGLQGVTPDKAAEITGKTSFPELISEPFIDGLRIAFTFSLVLFLLAAAASWMRRAMPPGPLDDVGEALEETVLA
jgi:hypothetical protein